MPDDDALVAVGVVARPHGVKGELRVHRFNPESRVLLDVSDVILRGNDDRIRDVPVTRARMGPKGAVLMVLEGVGGREAAEALRGTELCVPRSMLPPTDEDEWYFIDLMGLRAERKDGVSLGEVADVIEYPSVLCLAVRDGAEVREVPMVLPYLIEVRLEEGRVILDDIEDLPSRKATKRERSQ